MSCGRPVFTECHACFSTRCFRPRVLLFFFLRFVARARVCSIVSVAAALPLFLWVSRVIFRCLRFGLGRNGGLHPAWVGVLVQGGKSEKLDWPVIAPLGFVNHHPPPISLLGGGVRLLPRPHQLGARRRGACYYTNAHRVNSLSAPSSPHSVGGRCRILSCRPVLLRSIGRVDRQRANFIPLNSEAKQSNLSLSFADVSWKRFLVRCPRVDYRAPRDLEPWLVCHHRSSMLSAGVAIVDCDRMCVLSVHGGQS